MPVLIKCWDRQVTSISVLSEFKSRKRCDTQLFTADKQASNQLSIISVTVEINSMTVCDLGEKIKIKRRPKTEPHGTPNFTPENIDIDL